MAKKQTKEKVQKNVELVSLLASQIEEMPDGKRMRITPFAKLIKLSNGSHPHKDTVGNKLMEAYLWQQISSKVKFITEEDQIIELEKLETTEEKSNEKELREGIERLHNLIDKLQLKIEAMSKVLKK